MTNEWDNYESGPFCQHWGDPYDCEHKCKCGHECRVHWEENRACSKETCECEGFLDVA